MKIDLRKLYALKSIEINEPVIFEKGIYVNTEVKEINDCVVKGRALINYENNIELNLNVSGNFIIPCQISFEDVIVPFNTTFETEIDENTLNNDFYLDLSDILWENIILEIPIKVVKEGVKITNLQGEGWELKEDI